MSLKIDWATHEAAKYACENWHYSRCLPSGKIVKIGVWENARFIGVVLFSRGAAPRLANSFGLSQTECCELTRIALRQHTAPVTRIVSIAFRLLKRFCPGIKIVVSFADPNQGHVGGIYQGGNWIYTGITDQCGGFEYLVDGKWIHPRSIGAKFGTRKTAEIESSLKFNDRRKPSRKLRYVYPLDEQVRDRVERRRTPYPKRVSSKVSVAAADRAAEGGAIPTDTLHSPAGRNSQDRKQSW